jgi:molybdate transport system regulatory protein
MKNPFYLDSNFEIKKGDKIFLNAKRMDLLKAIKRKGSIRAASAEIKMSYQQAWYFVKEINEISPLPIVINKRGGASGGGAELTKYGELAITEFEKIRKQLNSFNSSLSENLWVCNFL